ncbi:MAG: gamma-glutamyl-gamma-aminobutyrate hydrolase family protein [bacterium]
MKPIIGIGGSRDKAGRIFVHENYINAVHKANGIPIILPYIRDEHILDMIHGMIITGGDDIPAELFGEKPVCKINPEDNQRLEHDLWLIQRLRERNIPTLGICYGMQIVNVSLGGRLYQDIQTQHTGAINHLQRENTPAHSIIIKSGTTLASILNHPLSMLTSDYEGLMVNSTHHQAVRDIGQGLIVSAVSTDGIIEAIESLNGWFLGVQRHPEKMDEESSRQIFSYIINKIQNTICNSSPQRRRGTENGN